jgi:hypothetical protein
MRDLLKASGIVAVIAISALAPGAKAQETSHDICRSIGGFTPEQLGDREHHALAINQESCQSVEGPTAGSVSNDITVMEWDGAHAKELSGFGVGRKPGATIAFQDLDGEVEITMTDGKPTGWMATGHSVVSLATGPWAALKGRTISWTARPTGPNVSELDYTWK